PRPKPAAVLSKPPTTAQEVQAQHPTEPPSPPPPPKDGTRAAPDAYDLLRIQALRANAAPRKFSGSIGHPAPTGSQKMQVYSNGVVNIGRTLFSLTKRMGGRTVTATWDQESIIFANTEGEVIAEYLWPPKGTAYVGIGKSRTRFSK
ncbi:IS481 family transposase, partial [Arthrobacter sp. 179]